MDRQNLIEITKRLYRLTILFPKKEPLRHKMRELANDILADFIKRENDRDGVFDTQDFTYFLDGNIDILNSYFAIVEEQKWVSSQNLLPLWQEYGKIAEYIKKGLTEESPVSNLFSGIKEKDNKEEGGLLPKPENEEALLVIDSVGNALIESDANKASVIFPVQEPVREFQSIDIKDLQDRFQPVKTSPRQEKIIDILKENGKGQVGEFKKVFPEITKRTLRRDFMSLLEQGIIERKGEKNNTFYVIKEA